MYPVRLLLFAISLVVSLAVLSNAASGFLTGTNPELALRINPFNSEARIYVLTDELSQAQAAEALQAWSSAWRGASLEPVDARYVSLLGIIQEDQGHREEAQRYYRAALEILPVEIQALSRQFLMDVAQGKAREAVRSADIILRRWPQYLDIVTPQLPVLLSDRDGYEEALIRFAKTQRGKEWLVSVLSREMSSTIIANRLILDWRSAGEDDLRNAINTLTARLVRADQPAAAYQLFLSTLNGEELAENGYVYNSAFNLEPNGNLFDWQFRNRSGMGFSIVGLPSDDSSDKKHRRALRIQFLDSPVRFNTVVMRLRLPPSQFRLNADYATRSLKGPKPVRLSIECVNGRKPLATFEFGMGTQAETIGATEFRVPREGCDLQQIRLMNDNFVESWRNRYSGALLLHSVSIERTGA